MLDILIRVLWPKAKRKGSGISSNLAGRIVRLLDAPGEGRDHVANVVSIRLDPLYFHDPTWG